MEPYYQDDLITIYNGDSREVLPKLKKKFKAIITDPVWPNAPDDMFGGIDPWELFKTCSRHFPRLADRSCIQLGIDSDPRILKHISKRLPFIRAVWMKYVFPNPKGRVLYSGDVAYVFGKLQKAFPDGKILLPGEVAAQTSKEKVKHPCPRKLEHMRSLVYWYGDGGPVLDPFMGSGTTLLAAKILNVPAVGIDIDEKYCEEAKRRVSQKWQFPFPRE